MEAAVLTGDRLSNDRNERFLRALASLPGRWGDAIEVIVKKIVILRKFENKREESETLLQILCAKRIFSINREGEGPYL